MLKTKYKIGLGLLITAASALTACGKKDSGKVVFWSSFGSSYTQALDQIVDNISKDTQVEIDHKPQGSYDEIYRNMISAIAAGDYPNLAIGYPDHFISYLGSGVLTPLDEYFSEAELADYYAEYMNENKFYDNGKSKAQERIFGIPFNKSTELLGYNGVFVDYCASKDPSLANIPATWEEWAVQGPKYDAIYQSMFGKGLYGVQDVFGTASQFEILDPVGGKLPGAEDDDGDIAYNGKKLLLDLTKVNKNNSILMGWDATDNAFITLVRQWGAEYTYVDPAQKNIIAKRRAGSVLFNSAQHQGKVIEMLKFFNGLNKQHIFGTPQTPLNANYCSSGYELCQVMFMICSSGGLSHNTADWHLRFRVAPIPYLASGKKAVISQGANICLTDKGNLENSVKVIKAFTTGKFQTEWCLKTGYYPCSKSATNSTEYQAFVHEAQKKNGDSWVDMTAAEAEAANAFASPVRVAYREGSKLNSEEYMDAAKGWDKFVDPSFEGSAVLRAAVKKIFDAVLSISDVDDTSSYKSKLDSVKTDPTITGKSETIKFVA